MNKSKYIMLVATVAIFASYTKPLRANGIKDWIKDNRRALSRARSFLGLASCFLVWQEMEIGVMSEIIHKKWINKDRNSESMKLILKNCWARITRNCVEGIETGAVVLMLTFPAWLHLIAAMIEGR